MSDELKACPFCGSAAMLYRGTINCTDEECAVAYSDDTDELITDLWNTRPIEDALRRERDDARAHAEKLTAAFKHAEKVAAEARAEVARLTRELSEVRNARPSD